MLPSKPIAVGRTAEVYEWGSDQVLKLYFDWCPPNWIDHEAHMAHAVDQAGISTPKVGEIVEIAGRRGIVYARINGPSMIDSIAARLLKLRFYGRTLAQLHLEMHRTGPVGLPAQRMHLREAISHAPALPDSLRTPILATLEAMPDSDRLCHNDFHPGNVILTPNGPQVIDWMTASIGQPAADVARTRLLLTVGDPPPNPILRLIILFARGLFNRAYLGEYRRHSPEVARLSDDFLPIMMAARLNENIPPEREKLLKAIRARWPEPSK
jgi:hypothetical protein